MTFDEAQGKLIWAIERAAERDEAEEVHELQAVLQFVKRQEEELRMLREGRSEQAAEIDRWVARVKKVEDLARRARTALEGV